MAKKKNTKEKKPEEQIEETKLEVANCDFKTIDNINIESLIRVIRGQQVMLDSDLTMLYGDETAIRLRSQYCDLKRGGVIFKVTNCDLER